MVMQEIRKQVIDRSGGRCENPRCRADLREHGCEVDHWLGGSGRRSQDQAVATCWALCVSCHQDRTLNIPDAGTWNRHFEIHCLRYGYSFTPHAEHASL
jgi:hypothetical protein